MKTNYNQWVAWYELSVKPYIMTPHSQPTRCGYATLKRPPKPFEMMVVGNQGNSTELRSLFYSLTKERG
jgi:hypothetical protein